MIKNHLAISSDPNVALESVGTQFEAQLKCLNGVLRSVRASTSVCEGNGFINKGRQALLHA
jgi:hypothetical protein